MKRRQICFQFFRLWASAWTKGENIWRINLAWTIVFLFLIAFLCLPNSWLAKLFTKVWSSLGLVFLLLQTPPSYWFRKQNLIKYTISWGLRHLPFLIQGLSHVADSETAQPWDEQTVQVPAANQGRQGPRVSCSSVILWWSVHAPHAENRT